MNAGQRQRRLITETGMRGLDGTNSWTGRSPPEIKFGRRGLEDSMPRVATSRKPDPVSEIVRREMGHGC